MKTLRKALIFGSLFGRIGAYIDKEITDEIENFEPAELNTLLEHFYAEVNNTKKVEIMNQKAFNDGIA